jgi:hypothetical protein
MSNSDILSVYKSLGWSINNRQYRDSSEFKTLNDFNEHLVNNNVLIDLSEYIENTNKGHFKCDISFMKDFMTLVHETGFVIRHSRLQTTGVVRENSCSSDVKKCLDSNFLVEGIDYNLRLESEVRENRGEVQKNVYMLTPRAFKKCLIRSKNTQIYASYYLMLEEAIVWYMKYQLELNQKCLLLTKDRCESLEVATESLKLNLAEVENKMEETKQKMQETENKMEETENKMEKNKQKMAEVENKMEETKQKMQETEKETERFKQKMEETEKDTKQKIDFLMRRAMDEEKKAEVARDKIKVIIPDRVIKPAAPDNGECLVFIKFTGANEGTFKATRCKLKLKNANIKKILEANEGATVWMDITHPNSKALFTLISQKIGFITVDKRKAEIKLKANGTETALRIAIESLEKERLEN